MSLTPGAKLGPYQIQDSIGVGGMGEVYRALDSRLDRTVAVKVLPDEVAADKERLSRFEREAKAVAALSHPNILAIHDFGKHVDTAYAVMELLEGETLKDRLEVGALPERKTIEIAAQMALGLGAAHEKSIVHRDLKPENIFITEDGQVKLLDFGLAKVNVPETATATAKTLGTSTDPGKVLGTVGYMSPEQVRGEATDHRSDIFSFGLILYEMISGQRAFDRDSAVETMSAIIREEPPELTHNGHSVLPALDRVVRRCIEKKPGERFQSARDLAFALENASGTTHTGSRPPDLPAYPSRNRLWRVLPFVVVFALGTMTGVALYNRTQSPSVPEPIRIRPLTFSGKDSHPAVSPDGRLVAFRSNRDGTPRIWIKQLAGGGEEPLTSGPDDFPQFSPDGSSLLFVRGEGSRTSAYRVAMVGGEPRKLIDNVQTASWSPDGSRIGFVRTVVSGSDRMTTLGVTNPRGGGEETLFQSPSFIYLSPRWSPDGSRISAIQSIPSGNSPDSLLIVDMTTRAAQKISPAGSFTLGGLAWTAEKDRILLTQAGSVIGDQSGALSRVLLYNLKTRDETNLFWAQGLMNPGTYSTFEIVAPGVLVFDEFLTTQSLVEFAIQGDLSGGRSWGGGNMVDRQPDYSPDGKTVIFSSNRSGNLDLWTLSVETGAVRQLTDDAAQDWDPAYTPDGNHILWSSDRGGNLEIWIADADGSGARQLSQDGYDAENPAAAPDGWVVYWSANPAKRGIWKIRTDGSDATHISKGDYFTQGVSPNGRYLAVLKTETVNFRNLLHVIEVETGAQVSFEIVVPYRLGSSFLVWGRGRWMPDGKAIAFVGQNEDGLSGVFVQDFIPGKDTSASRRPLAGFSPDYQSESFGISPDGSRLTLSVQDESYSLKIAEGVPGVTPPSRPGRP